MDSHTSLRGEAVADEPATRVALNPHGNSRGIRYPLYFNSSTQTTRYPRQTNPHYQRAPGVSTDGGLIARKTTCKFAGEITGGRIAGNPITGILSGEA